MKAVIKSQNTYQTLQNRERTGKEDDILGSSLSCVRKFDRVQKQEYKRKGNLPEAAAKTLVCIVELPFFGPVASCLKILVQLV